MACPRCGDVCRCYSEVRTPNRAQMRPRFEVETENSSSASSAVLVDPEQYDASEEQFSASLEANPAAQFIPDQPALADEPEKSVAVATRAYGESDVSNEKETFKDASRSRIASSSEGAGEPAKERLEVNRQPPRTEDSLPSNSLTPPDSWKEEVTARLNTYRAKRKPRPPKYPSLSLDFQPPPPPPGSGSLKSDLRTSLALDDWQQKTSPDAPAQRVRVVPVEEVTPPPPSLPATARLIEFPRFFAPEEVSPDQLAEPVCEHPRILDAPEVEMPAPALGGIVLDTRDEQKAEERPGFEMPLRSASVSRRALAATVDGAVIMSAGGMFGYIFLQLAKVLPPIPQLLASAMLVGTVLWAGYQYLLLTYSGTTPGLRLAKLRLIHFDGSSVIRSRRRWRALASILSAASLGLGFAWCFLDEDALCWHDRITRTHLAPWD